MDLPYLARLGSAAGTELASLEVTMQTLLHSSLSLHFLGHHSLPDEPSAPVCFRRAYFGANYCSIFPFGEIWLTLGKLLLSFAEIWDYIL